MTIPWDPVEIGLADIDAEDPDEQMGSKDKHWVRLAGDDRRWLVKIARVDARDGTVSGEDWAEWLVQHLAGLLGLPTALIRPATFEGKRAIVSRSVLHDDSERLVHGNELLSATSAVYDRRLKGENPGYTPSAVKTALQSVLPPREIGPSPACMAFDVWAGYLLLDAWMSGRDRHDENWGVVRRGNLRWLAPSFDHGNALGFQLRDDARERMLADGALLLRWVERGHSQHFAGKPLLTDLAQDALRLAASKAQALWWDRLRLVSEIAVGDAVDSVSSTVMSDASRRFVIQLLDVNRRRLLDGHRTAVS